MTSYRLSPAADDQVDEIYQYTANRWSEEQADSYVRELTGEFVRIASRQVVWRMLPASFAIQGYSRTWRQHVIYWRAAEEAVITVVAILHGRMDQAARAREAFAAEYPEPDPA